MTKDAAQHRSWSLAALPALGQGAPWPTRVSARAGSQAFYEVVKNVLTIILPSYNAYRTLIN